MPKLTYEEWKAGLSPAEEEARLASELLGDQEMLADIYRRVDPSVNPGGEYGLFPAIGQSRDGGARYKGVEVGVGDSYVSGELGSYLPEHNPVDEEGYVYSKRQGYPLSSQLLMEKGMDPLKPGEIYFQQFSGDVQPFKNTTRKEIEDPASTLIHEFFHRAVDAPWFDEFADWAENEASGSWTMPSTREAARTIRSLASSVEKEQSFAHTLDDTARGEAETNQYSTDVANQKKLVSMDKALRAFFTPERQEKYGLRLPLKATVPEEENTGLFDIFTTLPAMLLEKVPEALGFDKTGEGPVVVPEGFYEFSGPTMANGGDPSLGSSYMLPDPVYLANGGTGTNIFDNDAFTPTVQTAVPFFSVANQGYFDGIGGISKAQAYAMNTAIEDALAQMEEQDPSKWTQAQIDQFNDNIEKRILAAAAEDLNNTDLQNIAAEITQAQWTEWNEFLATYTPSGDEDADIALGAATAQDIFGDGSTNAKLAFLSAASEAGLSTEKVATAIGATEDDILAALPEIPLVDYVQETLGKVWEFFKTCEGTIIGTTTGTITSTHNCDPGSLPGVQQQKGAVPIGKIPGTNTTIGVDLGNDILNQVVTILKGGATGKLSWEDIQNKVMDIITGYVGDVLSEEARKEILATIASNMSEDGASSTGIQVAITKLCWNDDGSDSREVDATASCPLTHPNETKPEGGTSVMPRKCFNDAGESIDVDANKACPLSHPSETDPQNVVALTAAEICTNSGGTWDPDTNSCSCGDDPSVELVNGACLMKDMRSPQEVCELNRDGTATGNVWDDTTDPGTCRAPGTTPDDPQNPIFTECEMTDYTQTPDANNVYPKTTRMYTAAELKEIGGSCPLTIGNPPQGNTDVTCENVTDYTQTADANGVFPTRSITYTANQYELLGSKCPLFIGTKPKDPETKICEVYDYDKTAFVSVEIPKGDDCPDYYGTAPCKDENGAILYVNGAMQFPDADGNCPTDKTPPPKDEPCKDENGNDIVINGVLQYPDADGNCSTGGTPPKDEPCKDENGNDVVINGVLQYPDADGNCSTGGTPPKDEPCKDENGNDVVINGVLQYPDADGNCPEGTTVVTECNVANSEPDGTGGCKCKTGYTATYGDDGTLTACMADSDPPTPEPPPGSCPANSEMINGECVCDDGYEGVFDNDGQLLQCMPTYDPCLDPEYAAANPGLCGVTDPCLDPAYAAAHPDLCPIDGPKRKTAVFEGIDMVRPPWVTPPDVRIDRYGPQTPQTYSTLPAPASASMARRPEDVRQATSVIDPGYNQVRQGAPYTANYYDTLNRLSDYSTEFDVGLEELSAATGVPQSQFTASGFDFSESPAPAPATPPVYDRFQYTPPTEPTEEDAMFAEGGEVTEEPQGLESLMDRRQRAVNKMLWKRTQ